MPTPRRIEEEFLAEAQEIIEGLVSKVGLSEEKAQEVIKSTNSLTTSMKQAYQTVTSLVNSNPDLITSSRD